MKNFTKIPIRTEYENLNVKFLFDLHIIDLDKYYRDGFVYAQIIANDDTRPLVKVTANVKFDKLTAKVTLNIPIEISMNYHRGRNGDFIYLKDVNKLTIEEMEDL